VQAKDGPLWEFPLEASGFLELDHGFDWVDGVPPAELGARRVDDVDPAALIKVATRAMTGAGTQVHVDRDQVALQVWEFMDPAPADVDPDAWEATAKLTAHELEEMLHDLAAALTRRRGHPVVVVIVEEAIRVGPDSAAEIRKFMDQMMVKSRKAEVFPRAGWPGSAVQGA
jgi:hypothetical protein